MLFSSSTVLSSTDLSVFTTPLQVNLFTLTKAVPTSEDKVDDAAVDVCILFVTDACS